MPGVPTTLDVDDLVRRYSTGESCEDIAQTLTVSSATVLRRLRAAGVEIRQGPSYRRSDTMATLEKRARSREIQGLHIGPHEVEFAELLTAYGVEFIQQRAVGPYNLDFALVASPVAVEVVSGNGNTRLAANRRKRIEYLLDRSWWVIEVYMRSGARAYTLDSSVAEYLVTVSHSIGREPASRGQHRMVRADGQFIAARRRQVN